VKGLTAFGHEVEVEVEVELLVCCSPLKVNTRQKKSPTAMQKDFCI